MFKFVVFATIIALTTAKPTILHGGFAAPAITAIPSASVIASPVATLAAPAIVGATAVSQQARHDIISPGVATITTAGTAPLISAAAAPTIVAAASPLTLSSAVSSNIDIRRPGVAAVAAAPAVALAPTIGLATGGLRTGGYLYGNLGLTALGHP